jgi:hypothetical protein
MVFSQKLLKLMSAPELAILNLPYLIKEELLNKVFYWAKEY